MATTAKPTLPSAPTPTPEQQAAPTSINASQPTVKDGETNANVPDLKVQVVPAVGNAVPPNQAAPDGSDPSKFPRDGTLLEGLAAGTGVGLPPPAATVKGDVLDGNPPAYDPDNKHGIVEEPTAPTAPAVHCRMEDFKEGGTVYKLGVSHPPYKVESVSKGSVTLRAGTGGTVTINNNDEASFFTQDQSRQYAVADGNPNASGDVKHP